MSKEKPKSKDNKAARKTGKTPHVEAFKGYPEIMSSSSSTSANTPRLRLAPLPVDTSAHKFDLKPSSETPASQEPPAYEYLGELPEVYGTKKLFLTARDPNYLFAYWDLNWEQFQEAENAAHDRKVFLQVYHAAGDRVQQIQIHNGTRQWVIHVSEPDSAFYTEIGYYKWDGGFEVVTRSGLASTPRDTLSWKTHADFVTIPFNFTFQQLWELVRDLLLPGEDLAEALARLEAVGHTFPFQTFVGRFLSDDAHEALFDYMRNDLVRKIQVGSFEITEILKRQLQEQVTSGQWSVPPTSLSSPFGASFGVERNFFMHVNAELIIYGGTDPKAKVRVDGQEIALRPDGTFSYHFKFSDGRYHIPITAESPDKVETRSALLSFLRVTDTSAGVDATPQPPLPEPLGKTKSL